MQKNNLISSSSSSKKKVNTTIDVRLPKMLNQDDPNAARLFREFKNSFNNSNDDKDNKQGEPTSSSGQMTLYGVMYSSTKQRDFLEKNGSRSATDLKESNNNSGSQINADRKHKPTNHFMTYKNSMIINKTASSSSQ